MNLAPLKPRERSTAAYRLPTASRGIIQVGPMRARRRDVLGLASKTFLVPGHAELLVMPAHTPVPFSMGGSTGRLGDHLRLRAHGQSGSEFHSLRSYVPGDDLRRISWKASARTNELVVKETALEGVKRCTVVLDTDADVFTDSAFERAVSAAASLLTGAVAAGLASRLTAADIDLRGHDVAAQGLRWLATVQPSGGAPTLPTLGSGEGMGLVLVVTSGTDSRTMIAVRASCGPDETLVVVATSGAARSGRERFVVDASSHERFLSSWAQLTGSLGSAQRLPSAYQVAQ